MSASSRISLAAAALAPLACVATVIIALFVPGGHPSLADYVGAIALPLAWLLALLGLVTAVISRRSVSRIRFLLALTGNLIALLAGLCTWVLWAVIQAA